MATVGALQVSDNHAILELLRRHLSGDWGDVSKEDAKANEHAVKWGECILASNKVGEEKLWVITEADRSSTTVPTPGEYWAWPSLNDRESATAGRPARAKRRRR